jgi:glycosyltransferase involved in cell wall biosynthesis
MRGYVALARDMIRTPFDVFNLCSGRAVPLRSLLVSRGRRRMPLHANSRMTPRVSVLMTIYNPGPYLAPAIESLLAQTSRDFELIAVEDGSCDGTLDVARRYAGDPRVRLIECPQHIGRVPALNLALKEARAEYAAILDADDIAHPERLEREAALLDACPQTVLVASHARYIDAAGNVTGTHTPPTDPGELREALAYTNPFPHSSIMYRRAAALAAGGYCPRYPYANDLAMSLALTRQGEPAMIGRFLADVRFHAGNMSISPAHYFSRFDEMLELFCAALARPGLSARAKRLGSANLATTHYVFAKELAKSGRPYSACRQLLNACLADPLYCLRRACVHAGRLFAPKPGRTDVSAP